MTVYIIASLIIGFVAGFITASLLVSGKIADLRSELYAKSLFKNELDLLRARIRGIQHNGVKLTKGEITYAIQKPDGKFGKFVLPEV